MKVCSNYRMEALDILLCENCVLQRYYPLIPFKAYWIESFRKAGYLTRADCLGAAEHTLEQLGVPEALVGLLRRFLHLYDYRGKGPRDIPNAAGRAPEELAALLELMRLPGVKAVRGELYYRCGFRTLEDFAKADAPQLQAKLREAIQQEALPFSLPALKELRTQIAVALAFTVYGAE